MLVTLSLSLMTLASLDAASFRAICEQYAVPAGIVRNIIAMESGGDPWAVGKNVDNTYDLGLMQLNSRYLPWFAEKYNDGNWIDAFDQAVAVRVAVRYLADLHAFFGSWELAIAAYNCGPSRAASGQISRKTREYVRRVISGDVPQLDYDPLDEQIEPVRYEPDTNAEAVRSAAIRTEADEPRKTLVKDVRK